MAEMLQYKWADGWPITTVDGQLVGEELERIRQAHGGRLVQEYVVETARDPGNVLHRFFEWDDSKAAAAHRLEQAGQLIRCIVRIHPSLPGKPIRAFVNIVRDKERSYTSIGDAMAKPEERDQIIQRAWRELESWRDRHQTYVEFAEIVAVVDSHRRRRTTTRTTKSKELQPST